MSLKVFSFQCLGVLSSGLERLHQGLALVEVDKLLARQPAKPLHSIYLIFQQHRDICQYYVALSAINCDPLGVEHNFYAAMP